MYVNINLTWMCVRLTNADAERQ